MRRLGMNWNWILLTFCFAFFPITAKAQDQELKPALSILEDIDAYKKHLGAEISKIPGYRSEITGKELVALNNLSNLLKTCTSQQTDTLESFLKIGLPTKRAYCSPLQAIMWVLETENDTAVLEYSLEQLLDKAWTFTEANRWNDFVVVIDRLNAPELINYYERMRFLYDSRKGTKKGKKADIKNIFKTNIGNCVDVAAFTVYCMEKGGYKASFVNVHPSRRGYHTVCRYKVDGTKYILDNGRPDKFLRRGIVPADEYEMYHDKKYSKRDEEGKDEDPIYSLQDNYGLVLVYLMEQKDRIADMGKMCEALGIGPYEKKVKKYYMKALIDSGFILELKSNKKGGAKSFTYILNEMLCEKFKDERYHKPSHAAAKW